VADSSLKAPSLAIRHFQSQAGANRLGVCRVKRRRPLTGSNAGFPIVRPAQRGAPPFDGASPEPPRRQQVRRTPDVATVRPPVCPFAGKRSWEPRTQSPRYRRVMAPVCPVRESAIRSSGRSPWPRRRVRQHITPKPFVPRLAPGLVRSTPQVPSCLHASRSAPHRMRRPPRQRLAAPHADRRHAARRAAGRDRAGGRALGPGPQAGRGGAADRVERRHPPRARAHRTGGPHRLHRFDRGRISPDPHPRRPEGDGETGNGG
jgi:hypothetical protein